MTTVDYTCFVRRKAGAIKTMRNSKLASLVLLGVFTAGVASSSVASATADAEVKKVLKMLLRKR